MEKPCHRCAKPFEALRRARYCSPACRDAIDEPRFWSKVARGPGCWEWTASRDPNGYGWFSVGKTMRLAHSVALELKLGRPLQGLALHDCDNPPCCNPAHLYEGTHQNNADDRIARGRSRYATGPTNAATKLDEVKVKTIRALKEQGVSMAKIGALYDVSPQAISAILRGVTWKGVGLR